MNPHYSDDNDDRGGEPDESSERDQSELFTLGEVANLLRVPPATLRYWRNQHTGPRSFKVGRHVRYHSADLNEWLQDQRDAGGPGAA